MFTGITGRVLAAICLVFLLLMGGSTVLVGNMVLRGFAETEHGIVEQDFLLAGQTLYQLRPWMQAVAHERATSDDAWQVIRSSGTVRSAHQPDLGPVPIPGVDLKAYLDSTDQVVRSASGAPATDTALPANAIGRQLQTDDGRLLKALRASDDVGGLMQTDAGLMNLVSAKAPDPRYTSRTAGLLILGKRLDARRRHSSNVSEPVLTGSLDHTTDSILILDNQGVIVAVNGTYARPCGLPRSQIIGSAAPRTAVTARGDPLFEAMIRTVKLEQRTWRGILEKIAMDDRVLIEDTTVSSVLSANGTPNGYVVIKHDVTAQKQLEDQLARAQKLEAIGQLAAGIAHEINTPTQYVSDNIHFVRESFSDLDSLLGSVQQLADSPGPAAAQVRQALAGVDFDFLRKEIPKALEQSADGCQRIATIVRAMKEFSHPARDKTPVDLNHAIQSTITVATNEWKYVAEIAADLDPDLPYVSCVPGEINQVILNMLVNAAHAISDVVGDGGKGKGVIRVSTRRAGDFAEIRIRDTGTGISPEVRRKIFDPFFTTKPVGRGTGQGLAIAHDVIVNRHGGSIALDSTPGQGSTFILRIPFTDSLAGYNSAPIGAATGV